jgi:hypothetical protein
VLVQMPHVWSRCDGRASPQKGHLMSTFLFALGRLASRHPWRVVGVWLPHDHSTKQNVLAR